MTESERFLLSKLMLALKRTLDSKHQLLPYLREQIQLETLNNFSKLSDDEVKLFMKLG